MFQLKSLDTHSEGWRMVIAFDYPFGKDVVSFAENHTTKLLAMYSFSSNANTMLDVPIEEFSILIETKIINHFKFQKCYPFYNDMQFLGFYWDWKCFLEQIAEKRNHRHGYAKAIKDNIHLFQNIVPQYEGLSMYKEPLTQLINEVLVIAKNIMEVSTKIQKELYGDN